MKLCVMRSMLTSRAVHSMDMQQLLAEISSSGSLLDPAAVAATTSIPVPLFAITSSYIV